MKDIQPLTLPTSEYDGLCEKCEHRLICVIEDPVWPTYDCRYFLPERLHGRWIERKSFHAEGGVSAKCSACQNDVQYLGNPLKYCPNCGAKMDLVDGDPK